MGKKPKVSPYIPVNNIDYFMPKPTDWLDWMEKYTREAPPNMDYDFMNKQLIFAKHLLKLLDDNGIKVIQW